MDKEAWLRGRFRVRQRWILAHHGEYELEGLIDESVEQLMRDVRDCHRLPTTPNQACTSPLIPI